MKNARSRAEAGSEEQILLGKYRAWEKGMIATGTELVHELGEHSEIGI